MSDLVPVVTALGQGLDLKSPKLMAAPGSLIDCLNYEITDRVGYRRIDGFVPYDGHVTLKDFEGAKYWSRRVDLPEDTGSIAYPLQSQFILDANNDIIGWCFSITQADVGEPKIMRFMSFLGNPNISGYLEGDGYIVNAAEDAALNEITITVNELRTLENDIRRLVPANTEESVAVGLHWHRDHLYGAFPLVCVAYSSDAEVTVTAGNTLSSTLAGVMPLITLDKIMTTSTISGETGYIICLQTGTGELEPAAAGTETLSGGVSAGAGTVYHETGCLRGVTSLAAHVWKATRQNPYVADVFDASGGWQPLAFTYSVRANIDLSATTNYILKAVKRGYSPADASVLTIGTFDVVLEDYFVASGDMYEAGGATVVLQVSPSSLAALVPFTTLASELAIEDADAVSLGSTISRPRLVFAAGFAEDMGEIEYIEELDTTTGTTTTNKLRGLSFSPSRYTWKSANFFASDFTDAFYGCNGAGRAIACTPYTLQGSAYAGTFSWIYTQDDENKDRPRHLENHNQHLLLAFREGSIQSSVVGTPTNFAGVEGASEIGVGDKVTGVLALPGSTSAIFCESSIWSLQGQNVDNFNTQMLSPNVGAIEYTVANCGMPVFLNQYGVSTLEQTAAYGDFVSNSVSQTVSPWLVPRCRLPYPNADFYEGVVGAFPVRKKNQYRVFFNDGECLTATFTEDGVKFTRQVYQIPVDTDVDEKLQRLIPLAWTSQIDNTGRERIMVSHYDKRVVDTLSVPPVVISNPLEEAFLDVPVNHQYAGSGGIPPYTFSIVAGALPTGLSMNSSGNITGTPAALGPFAWRAKVTDAIGQTDTLDQGVDIEEGIDGGEFEVTYASPSLISDVDFYIGNADALVSDGSMGWANNINIVSVSPDGIYAAGGVNGSTAAGRFEIRKYDTTTGAWSALPNPSDYPTDWPQAFAWSPDGVYLALTTNDPASERIWIYKRTGDTFTRLAAPVDGLPSNADSWALAWNADGSALAVGNASSVDGVFVWDFVGETLINRRGFASPGTNFIGGAPYRLDFNGDLLACQNSNGVFVVDTSQTPMPILDYAAGGYGIGVTHGCYWTADGNHIVSVDTDKVFVFAWDSGTSQISLVNSYQILAAGAYDTSIDVSRRYIACAEGNIEIVDLGTASPPVPTVLGNLSAASTSSVSFSEVVL